MIWNCRWISYGIRSGTGGLIEHPQPHCCRIRGQPEQCRDHAATPDVMVIAAKTRLKSDTREKCRITVRNLRSAGLMVSTA
ncbi:MAG: hypothetical protein LUQ01_06400 [Methanolinea sp.]|nr:hypothetical protein [Methanolinea sp.]